MLGPNANDLFSVILELEDPWFVEDVKVVYRRVDVTIATRARALVACPVCGEMNRIHDRIERTWRHTDVCDSECFMTAKIPRCDCPKCGVKQIEVPWARNNVGYTKSFEQKAMSLMRRMPLTKAADELHVGTWVLESILRYHVNKALDSMDLSGVSRIFLDETSSKRGHRYMTVIADVDTKKIIFMTEGRGADPLARFTD